MKILFISHRIPYPPNKGDKLRAFHIIEYLSRKHDICLVSLYDDKKDEKHASDLRRFCEEVHLFYLNPFPARIKAFFCLFSNRPFTAGYFYSRKIKSKIKELMESKKFDLIFAYSSSVAQYVMGADIKKVMDFVDCDSAKWAQYERIACFPISCLYGREHKLLMRYEKKIVQKFDRLIVVSESEKEEFSRFTDTEKFSVIVNGVETEYFKPSPGEKSNKLIFTGAMDYLANIDGVVLFCREVFPAVRRRFSDAEFYIVGPNPVKRVRRLAKTRGVFVAGFVDDVRRYLEDAAVFVAPSFRIAQGLQNKILEAMASGLAVVTTSAAIKPLAVKPDENILVADEAGDFASKIIALLEMDTLRKRIGENARVYVKENHNWEINLSKLNQVLK